MLVEGFCPEFNEDLWYSLLDYATVYTKDDDGLPFGEGWG